MKHVHKEAATPKLMSVRMSTNVLRESTIARLEWIHCYDSSANAVSDAEALAS
jgi:hypothetical protein